MDFESQIENIAKDIRDREDKELALAFTNVVGSLLRENGVFVKTSRNIFGTDKECDKNKYIIKKEYGISIDGLDFTEHDKVFEDKIELLNRNLNLQKDKRCEAEIERNYLAERFNQLKDENDELKQRIAELENENKNLNIRIFQNEIEKEKKNQIAELESELESKGSEIERLKKRIGKLASIRVRCHESARDSFDLGNYGCLHIVTADELKTTKDNIQKINLNETIKVKLTPYGAEIYYKQFDELNKKRGREICKPQMPRIDKDGYTEFQLWHFIELYGQHIGVCKPNVIEPLDIVYCRNNREEVK